MKCSIIAEVGWNHMGDVGLAKQMIDAAAKAGADYVKFQTWSVEDLVSGTWDTDGRRQIYEKAELTREKHEQLLEYCLEKNVRFLTSVFNVKHVKMLKEIGCKEIKIASCEALNRNLVNECIDTFDKIYISTGGLTEGECAFLVNFVSRATDKVILLHCVSLYPCPDNKSNIGRMTLLNELSDCDVGYSDHTAGTYAPFIAISKGAKVIEKHFTTDNDLPGRDNKNACLPKTLEEICEFRNLHHILEKNVTLGRDNNEAAFEEFRGRWSKKQ
jgi:N,N'-diacetyllegionaminate synthase